MAVKKRTAKSPSANTATSALTMSYARMAYLVVLICLIALALAMFWKNLPQRQPISPEPLIKVNGLLEQKRSCEFAGGKWTECGNPCQGLEGEVCATVCEPQCLCGGDAQYGCPFKTKCLQKIRVEGQKEPIGICRDHTLPERPIVERTPTTPQIHEVLNLELSTSSYPYTLNGSASGVADIVYWIATDGERELGRGAMIASSTMQERFFLPRYTTSSVVRVDVTYGSAKQVWQVPMPTTPMSKTLFQPATNAQSCTELDAVTRQLPFTNYPFEARMRSALGDGLWSFSVQSGQVTIQLAPKKSFSSECGYDQLKAIAEAITNDTPSITQLLITDGIYE